MIPLTDYLCRRYKLTTAQLVDLMQNEQEKLYEMLRGQPLYTGHTSRRDALPLASLSSKPLSQIYVNTGNVETSLIQFLYSKFSIQIKHPEFHCLVFRNNMFDLDFYYPIEKVLINVK